MPDVCPCHGEPWYIRKNGPVRLAMGCGPTSRVCITKKRAGDRALIKTEKGRARRRRADARYRETHIRIRVGGDRDRLHLGTYPVTTEQREAIQAFRAKQRKEIHGRQH